MSEMTYVVSLPRYILLNWVAGAGGQLFGAMEIPTFFFV